MSTTTDHETEAREQLASRAADMRAFLEMDDAHEGTDEMGSVYDYGLEWTAESRSYRDSTITYRHVVSTGGPHEELLVTFAESIGEGVHVTGVTFVSLPWFDRVEIPVADDDERVWDFYGAFFADLVDVETGAYHPHA